MKVHDAALSNAVISGCPVRQGATADLVDPWLYSDGDAHAVWRGMRAQETLTRQEVDDKRGFWNIVGFDDADHVLRDTAAFTSERGTMLDLLGTDDPAGGKQLAVTDPPRHTEMQTRLKKALAVKAVERQKDMIRPLVVDLIAPLGDGGTFDFAEAMLAMPMSVTGTMMDLPRADWSWLSRLTTICIAADDPEYQDAGGKAATLERAHRDLFAYFQDLLRFRRRNLGDDLLSVLISTEFEGRHMDPGEIVANCYSLLLGANVTTPHSPNYVMAEFIDKGVLEDWAAHPELNASATEEALRWASPVNHFLRYATRDVEVRNTRISAGDAVVVWLGSANRDEAAFPDAGTFDIRRRPNKHIAFGIGPHYCIGHSVARITLRILFEELLTRFEDFQPAGRPERLASNFVSGWKHVPVTARPRARTDRTG
ncbi:cytochrome P450 [Streptomyces sp. RB110-1]|uniref:cytochrome P450 n=1 Tax=unclassified Streptomyces TaxID=2593676 RepID=UPI0019010EC7|nr:MULTISPECIES: cytochrome P450 [unclassified Streptomyces]MBK0376418.1 cytochrome P450 [Streptomyces sp. RB110-1]MBK0387208.1 cytochrome P450 [Streptomyces sp. RB110-2]